MQYLPAETLSEMLRLEPLLDVLQKGFCEDITVPLRHHHHYANPAASVDSTFLLMPAWEKEGYLGVKLITVSPENPKQQLPSIQGLYVLFEVATGNPLLTMDAKSLTLLRTSAASALASRYLSRTNSDSLLMVGTGALAPYLVRAHAGVRPIEKVWVWGRNFKKAQLVAEELKEEGFEVEAVASLNPYASQASIISCATMAKEPLIKGEWLREGQHLDLVGSYLPDHREVDDECIRKSSLYVDIMEGATKESGDIVMPLDSGLISQEDIRGDLFDLCQGKVRGRTAEAEISLFKSVGHALEDLVAAKLAYELYNS